MPCPECGSTDVQMLAKRKTKRPLRIHEGFHYDAQCNSCHIALWRHGDDGEKEPLVWHTLSNMFCNGCR
jgi:hypothetical protein